MPKNYKEILQEKKLIYILSFLLLLLTFNVFYLIGKHHSKDEQTGEYRNNIVVNEKNLLETARLQLQSSHRNYHDFENRKYNGIQILCNKNNKILYSIDLEKYGTSPNEDPLLINDYRILYIGLEKEGEYYYEKDFTSEELLNEYPLDKEKYCEE